MRRMNRTLVVAGLGALMTLPLAAQDPGRVEVRRNGPQARVWINGKEVDPMDWVANRRARIGVTLDMNATENDSVGATISSVTPGGPAAKAGIRAGDVVTRLNGQRLLRPERPSDDEGSLAALQLIELMAKVEPGDTVRIDYRRGKDTRTASIVTDAERSLISRDFGDGAFSFRMPSFDDEPDGPSLRRMIPLAPEGDGRNFAFGFGGPFADLELAPINPDLGAYFGTSEGVLVIDTPARNSLGLKGGDVILSIDGRKARGPASLLRILRSYENGEVIKLEILRNKSRQTISSKIERDD
ncbi:MAG: PDZ domain-containing protein [Gemmatimonadales bacterium]